MTESGKYQFVAGSNILLPCEVSQPGELSASLSCHSRLHSSAFWLNRSVAITVLFFILCTALNHTTTTRRFLSADRWLLLASVCSSEYRYEICQARPFLSTYYKPNRQFMSLLACCSNLIRLQIYLPSKRVVHLIWAPSMAQQTDSYE